MLFTPTKAFLTKGIGYGNEEQISLEQALRHAGISEYNLVPASGIFPPEAKIIPRKKGLQMLEQYPGAIVHCVMSTESADEPNRLIAAAIGIALPENNHGFGYISRHHTCGMTEKAMENHVEDLAAQMLATKLDLPFDPDKNYNDQKEQWELSDKIITTRSVVQSKEVTKKYWVTVLSALVFCDYETSPLKLSSL